MRMSNSDDKNSEKKTHSVIPFPQSRVKPKASKQAPRDLGFSKLAQELNASASLKGNWCSRCKASGMVMVANVNVPFVVIVTVRVVLINFISSNFYLK